MIFGGFDLDLKDIQIRLRESIRNSAMSQKEIAAAIQVSPQTISKYMNKDVFPALDTLARLCKLLDVKSDYILGLSEF
ncbi:MAG: helix-turn-helix domain-containing protein [Eubacteriales bacterium]